MLCWAIALSGTLNFWRITHNGEPRSSISYKFTPGSEIRIEHLSPGKYGYNVNFPGTRPEQSRSFEVTNNPITLSPKLRLGTTVIVPLDWKDGRQPPIASPDYVPWPRRQQFFATIRRDGKATPYRSLSAEASKPHFGQNAVFDGLAPGTYEVCTPGRIFPSAFTPEGLVHLRPLPAKITVTIPPDPKPVITTAPLPIAFEVVSE